MISHLVETYHLDLNTDDEHEGLNELAGWAADGPTGTPLNYAVTHGSILAAECLLKYGPVSTNCF